MPHAGSVRLSVRVSPGSARTRIGSRLEDGSVSISLKSAPVDGRANTELVSLLASAFGTDRRSVRIVTGGRSRRKLVSIENPGRIPDWFRQDTGI